MGSEFVRLYRENIKREWKIAFFSTFVGFLIIHIYKLTNNLPNHDTLSSFYSPQDMTVSGRWFLQYACGISSYFDLPWLNGLLSAFYLGITVIFVVEVLDIQNPIVIALSGLILAASPSTTETLLFEFTADGYFLGMLLSAFAAWLSCKGTQLWHWCAAGACLCISCAIYQSYVPFAGVLCVLYLVLRLVKEEISVGASWRWIGKHVLLYGIALVSYYGIWKLILSFTERSATNYQGISEVGKIGLSTLLGGSVKSIKNLLIYFLEWNILENPITLYAVLNIVFLIALVVILVVVLVKAKIYCQPVRLLMILLCIGASVPMISLWSFVSETVQYHPMMLHSICLFYIFALILFDKWVDTRISTLFGLFLVVVVFNFAVMANISYFYLDKCSERTEYMGYRMMSQIEDFQYDDQEITGIAFIGSRAADVCISDTTPGSSIHLLSAQIESDFLYDHAHAYDWLQEKYGLDIPSASAAQRADLQTHEAVQKMGTWPEKSSIAVFDGILVIKLAESTLPQS